MADLVYSTDSKNNKKIKNNSKKSIYSKSAGPVKMRLETKGRNGKAVTVLFNLPYETAGDAKAKLKELQGFLSCGGTFKNSTLEFRGDVRNRLKEYFDKKGEKLIPAGG